MGFDKSEKLCKPTAAPPKQRLELSEVRARLEQAQGPKYWRSLEEIANTPGFEDMLHREFPRQASEWVGGDVSRRDFLKVMGASLALAGLSACTKQPVESIVPYVTQPENIVPGLPLYYATAMPFSGTAFPVLVESHMARPTKIEGNPEHPAGLGGTDVFMQASVLGLYDPDRSQTITKLGEVQPWAVFLDEMRKPLNAVRALQGAGLRFLSGNVTSPTLQWQLGSLMRQMPQARWYMYEAVNRDNEMAGAMMAFGQNVQPRYQLANADVIVTLDADLFSSARNPQFLVNAREYARRRKLDGGKNEMNRLYAIESTPSNTGGKADNRLAARASEIEGIARALASAVGVGSGPALSGEQAKFIAEVARELNEKRGRSLVIAGEAQPPAVHALAFALNEALGNVGSTVVFTDPVVPAQQTNLDAIKQLVAEMNAGQVETLVILGGNPVYDAPADLKFGEALKKVKNRVHLSEYYNETSDLCQWHVNEAHYLESWGDVRCYDGTVTIMQPLIQPLYGGRSALEVIGAFTEQPGMTPFETVQAYWQTQMSGNFQQAWQRALHDGFVPNTHLPAKSVSARGAISAAAQAPSAETIEVIFRPDPNIYDGRFANNGWLMELPRPLTKVTWDNVAQMSPAMAEKLKVTPQDVIEIEFQGRKIAAPAWVSFGHPENSITLGLGFGRAMAGKVGTGIGYNAYELRSSSAPYVAIGAKVTKTRKTHAIAGTQEHFNMEDRDPVRSGTLEEYRHDPEYAKHRVHNPPPELTLYPDYREKGYYDKYSWGMTIDINSCIGCNACVVACQAENNIPVVGKDQVSRGREMLWLRVDAYYEGSLDSPRVHFQPVPCMHCELAPCEPVCPVGATVHDTEGLNEMVYNRCVGTRYCSNNCPYKVRRFNYLLYSDWNTESTKFQRNPDVTVRSRGVMEKCTYCIQRISAARIEAEKRGTPIKDGEVITACQQACPTEAIVFGNLNDSGSRVAQLKKEPRDFSLLADLNTRPHTTYLSAVNNPNPALTKPGAPVEKH